MTNATKRQMGGEGRGPSSGEATANRYIASGMGGAVLGAAATSNSIGVVIGVLFGLGVAAVVHAQEHATQQRYTHQLELCRFFRDLVAHWTPKVRRLRKKRKR